MEEAEQNQEPALNARPVENLVLVVLPANDSGPESRRIPALSVGMTGFEPATP